jgi:general secretion pathway protein D
VVDIPGVIRPPSRGPETTEEITSAERGIVIGSVKIVADDRTGILIIVTHPQNMKFFDNIVKALDVPTDPDVVVKVFRLEYSQAEEVAKMLNDLIGAKSAKAEEAPAGGAAAAAGGAETPEARSAALQDYIRRQAQAQAQKEASEAAAGKTKIGELSATNIKILSDKRSNALIIMASKSDMAALDEIIKDMDIMLSQVLIEAVVVEVTLSKRLETGFDWVQRSMIVFEQNADGSRSPVFSFAGAGGGGSGAPLDATTVVPSSSAGLTYYLTYFNLNMDAVLKMVASDSRAQVLQAPVILTTDNNKAVIDVSTEDYFYKGQKFVTTSSSGAGEWVDDVETKKVGLNLTVTPRINKKKFVVMELAQKISNVTDYRAIGNGQWPVVGSREFTASIAVRSGETIVLGGLVYDTSNRTRSKIPLLGDIPLLGLAFGSNLRGRQTTELIVFITPYVLDTPEEIMAEAQRRKGSLHVDGVWKRGWSSSKLAEPRPEDMDAPAAPATPTNAPVSPPAGLPE